MILSVRRVSEGRLGVKFQGICRLVERFQSSNHMRDARNGRSKRPHSVDGRPTKRLSGFMESIV
jgi:hypothetical protein